MNFKGREKLINFLEKIHLHIFECEMSSIMRKFIADLSFVFIFMAISSILGFVFNIFGARILGVTEFGTFQIMTVIAQFIMMFMLFGVNTSTAKYISKSATNDEKMKVTSASVILFIASLTVTAVVSFGIKNILSSMFNVDIVIVGQSILFAIVLSVLYFTQSILQGWQRVRVISILGLIAIIITIGIFILFIFLNKKEVNYFVYWISLSIGYAVSIIGSIIYSKQFVIIAKVQKKTYKKLFNYGIFAIIGSMSGILLSATDKLILNYYYDVDVVGLYSVYVLATTVIFMQIISIFNIVFFPYVSASNAKIEIAQKITKIIKFIFFGTFILSAFSIVIVMYLVGNSYIVYPLYIILFSTSASIMIIYQIKMWFLNAEGIKGIKITIIGTISIGILNLLLDILFIQKYGIIGAISATIVSNILLYFYFTHKINRIFLYGK